MKKELAWAVRLVVLSAGIAWADGTLSRLDGTSWKVNVNPEGMAKDKGEKNSYDTVTFADSKLATNEGPKLGFGSAPYTLSRSGGKDWSFTAAQKSDTHGKYAWSGTIRDGDMRGKLVWTKRDESVLTYTFTGDGKQ